VVNKVKLAARMVTDSYDERTTPVSVYHVLKIVSVPQHTVSPIVERLIHDQQPQSYMLVR